MTEQLVRVEAVKVSGKDAFADLNRVRTAVRRTLYGRTEPVGAIVEVIWPSGEIDEWEFDRTVGYPTNVERDWMKDWIESLS